MKTAVVDSWAVLAWIQRQAPAWEIVQNLFDQADNGQVTILMSAINAGEVFYILAKSRSRELAERFRRLLGTIPMSVVVPDLDAVWGAAELKAAHRTSYADGFAARLALSHDCELYTGDPEFGCISSLRVHRLTRSI